MDQSDSWLQTPRGKIMALLLCVAAMGVAIWEIKAYLHGNTPGDPNTQMYVDSETGKAFPHKSVVGEMIPITSPFTGNKTAYPGVPCFWTADGQLKKDPTWLILNETLGKRGPTFCPDCGRLVRPMQPMPKPGDKPPPTRDELLHAYPTLGGATH